MYKEIGKVLYKANTIKVVVAVFAFMPTEPRKVQLLYMCLPIYQRTCSFYVQGAKESFSLIDKEPRLVQALMLLIYLT